MFTENKIIKLLLIIILFVITGFNSIDIKRYLFLPMETINVVNVINNYIVNVVFPQDAYPMLRREFSPFQLN